MCAASYFGTFTPNYLHFIVSTTVVAENSEKLWTMLAASNAVASEDDNASDNDEDDKDVKGERRYITGAWSISISRYVYL